MKLRVLIMLTLIAFCFGSTAMAFNYNYAALGNVSTSPFDGNNNTAPIEYPGGVGFLPSPGTFSEGGERYDLEGFSVAFEGDFMYVSLTNSYGMSVTSTTFGTTFRQGDIFFGSAYGDNTYALDITARTVRSVDAWSYIQNQSGSYYPDTIIRNRVGAHEVAFGATLGTSGQVLTEWAGLEYDPNYSSGPLDPDVTNGDTWVFEWRIERSLLGFDGKAPIYFHTTVGCGNDLIEYTYPGIPEPGTLMLLGFGLIGAGLIKRRR